MACSFYSISTCSRAITHEIIEAILKKLYMQIHVMVIQIHILSFMKFCPWVTKLWLNLLILYQHKGNNSCTTDAILTKLDVHQSIMVVS